MAMPLAQASVVLRGDARGGEGLADEDEALGRFRLVQRHVRPQVDVAVAQARAAPTAEARLARVGRSRAPECGSHSSSEPIGAKQNPPKGE